MIILEYLNRFQEWKEYYDRWLRTIYTQCAYLCYKHEKYNPYKQLDWKSNELYTHFCWMLYQCSLKKNI